MKCLAESVKSVNDLSMAFDRFRPRESFSELRLSSDALAIRYQLPYSYAEIISTTHEVNRMSDLFAVRSLGIKYFDERIEKQRDARFHFPAAGKRGGSVPFCAAMANRTRAVGAEGAPLLVLGVVIRCLAAQMLFHHRLRRHAMNQNRHRDR